MPLIRRPASPDHARAVDSAAVFAALAGGTNDERWAAARVIAGLPDGIRALGRRLALEQDKRIREAMLTALARTASAECVEIVLPFLRSDDAHLRTGALDALRAMKGAVTLYMPQLLSDHDADVRLLACELARNLPSDQAARLLCTLLDEERDVNVCASVVEVLAEVGGPESLPALARCADRFRGTAFLDFSIALTADRIRSQSLVQRE